ncbi:MAG: right-handed parallel beta-helix repeat-containing protein, partial [Thermoguttaceae bacterium]|nr:right-handed parallel beta-helix repeat-containing protein [Thermoguttaceae bacterium]
MQKPFSLRLEELEKRDLLSVEPFATAQTGPAELIAQNSAAVVQEQISLASNAAADGSGTVSTSERLGEDNRSAKGGAPAAGNSISVVIKDCEIYNNEAAGNGGALYVGRGDASVSNSAITDNTAKRGGGIYAETDQTVTVASNTISGNTATEEGGGIFACGPVCLYNTIVSLNSLNDLAGTGTFSAYNSLSSDVALVEGENNLVYDAAKPLFADAENGDYRLAENSQAHNAGSNDYVSQDTDLAGERRIVGSAVDIGAYELFQPDLSFNQYSKTVTAVVDRNVVLTRGVVATDLDNPTYTVQVDGVKSTKITVNKTWGQIVYSGGNNGLPARDEPYVVTVTASDKNGAASADFLLTVVNDSMISLTVTNSPKYNNLVRSTIKPTKATVTYQWYRTKNATPATAVWTAISGATKVTYVPTNSDLGYYLMVIARGTDAYEGHATRAITSGKVTRPIISVTLPTTVEY